MAESSSAVSASVIGGTHPDVMAMVEDACRATQQPEIESDDAGRAQDDAQPQPKTQKFLD